MEQFRHIGEVLGSIKAIMVLQDDIQINRNQCRLLHDIFSLAFDTIAEEIKQNLRLEEKNSKWKALDQPLRELHRVFKEGELYIRQCLDSKYWWGKAISFHQNKDSVEFHVHNLFCHFPAVIEAIENAGEISGLDQFEMQKRRVVLMRKYDKEWNDPILFQWRFGKQYLVLKDICKRLESAWREDRWRLVEALQEKRSLGSSSLTKNELRLADMLLHKLNGSENMRGKLFPSAILLGGKDYSVRRRLGGGSQYKEIQWLGETFALRHFFGDVEPLTSEISTLLSLSHSNILQYLCGFCDEEKKECFLVMELMNKDLSAYMKENSSPRRRILFSLPVVVDLMLQIARGMEYLHAQKICHGELNPYNIFLKVRNSTEGYLQAKISGFGLSSLNKTSPRNSPPRNAIDHFIWHAPEVLAQQEQPGNTCDSKYTEKADVYSFGMICFELLTGKVPFEDGHLQGDKMSRNIRAGERPLFPYPSPKYLVSLTRKCWQTDPSQRPSFSSICRILRYIKKFLVMNHQDQTLPQLQLPSVDYCEIETLFLKKISAEGSPTIASVSQIPFEMFSYRLLEKEKTCIGNKDNNSKLPSDAGSICKDAAALEDPLVPASDARSVCFAPASDARSVCFAPASDARSVCSDVKSFCSETPAKKTSLKKRPELKGRRGSGTPKTQTPKSSTLNPCGRSLKMNKDGQLSLLMSPVRQTRGRRSGHVSDSEIH
ncbi:hypothetical protein UlMin_002099 [Ulmus minor]